MATAVAKQTKKARRQVIVEFQSENASEVFIAGTFNDWQPGHDRLSRVGTDGCFRAELSLPKGRYEYKLVVDNVWCTDPKNPESVPNDQGSTNSVLIVP